MPRSSTRNGNSSAADKRRAVFKNVLYKPLPLRKRKWQPINAQCPICLQEDHEEYGLSKVILFSLEFPTFIL